MADNPRYLRDVRGRFARVPVELAYADDSKFDTVAKDGIDVRFQGADSGDLAYATEPRYAPEADDSGSGPVQRRRPVLVPPEDTASTIYGNRQGALTRLAARNQAGPLDPTVYLTHGD